jgi:putative NIF3 family GTP cyclohydrolase 1 type 2
MDETILYQVIDPDFLEAQSDEWGISVHNQNPTLIGFATTLTPMVIHQAISKDIDLLVTHHDIWEFMLDERTESHDQLSKHKISHIWCHEPLDKSDFGTAAAFLKTMGCEIVGKIADGYGRVGKLQDELELITIIEILERRMSERPRSVHNAGKPIANIACVPGAGMMVNYLAEAIEFDADLFVTGETSLYLLEYGNFRNVSILIYSHNYTEIFGTQNLARKIANYLKIKEIIQLDESHF